MKRFARPGWAGNFSQLLNQLQEFSGKGVFTAEERAELRRRQRQPLRSRSRVKRPSHASRFELPHRPRKGDCGPKFGPAIAFANAHRRSALRISIITVGELTAGAADEAATRRFLSRYRVVSLKPQIAYLAGRLEPALSREGSS